MEIKDFVIVIAAEDNFFAKSGRTGNARGTSRLPNGCSQSGSAMIFDFLPDDVWEHSISDLSCRCWCSLPERNNKIILDLQSSVGMGIFGRRGI